LTNRSAIAARQHIRLRLSNPARREAQAAAPLARRRR
jgi:hypothetical protein